jgi:hypothetical protein
LMFHSDATKYNGWKRAKKLKYYFLLCQPFSSMPPHSKFDYQF